ncbi:diguanylate cyclase (GGDEF)-like protein [Pseudomonas fluvialis]|uniref:diguanylate cyclase n=1 Tax=Pseudomonas fluvialis TaxID=1793966 RepID=A0A7X0EUP0_9PSED|nr:sensor domain-containing diguanylate cyclase [Pseudomonas fluvialis]MBB6342349.1 diguanylate cyclase (GGDEF)-like protein [Pseudomonas fluvialis]
MEFESATIHKPQPSMNPSLPPASLPTRAAKLRTWQAIGFVLAVCGSLVTLTLWGSWNSRQYRLHESEVALSNLAQALSSQVHATFKQTDTSLLWLVSELESAGTLPADAQQIRQLLELQLTHLEQLKGLFIIDAKGIPSVTTVANMPANLNYADRAYFKHHRAHDDRLPHIGHSIRSRTSGEWVMTISRRFNHPDGRFGGVVVATITLEHFLSLYRNINTGTNGAVTLISGDARVLVRRPFNEGDIGKDLSNGPLFTELLPKAPYGTATARSAVDGVERIVGYRRVDEYPLITFVALDREESLAAWRKETLFSVGLMLLLLSILGALSYRLIRLMRRQNYVQLALFLAQEQLLDNAAKLQAQALEDGLTGLANRRLFDQYLLDEMGRARREQLRLALLMIDVDHFKRFNDQHGHLAGDECLQIVASRIRQTIKRPGDMAFRYGGEEFAVVLPGADASGALVVAEAIRKAIESSDILKVRGEAVKVTASIGLCSVLPGPAETPESLIQAADRALYAAKLAGRNRTVDESSWL